MRHRLTTLLVLVALGAATDAAAQDGRAFVAGGVVWSAQKAGRSDSAPDHRRPGIGGSTGGVVASAGVNVLPRLAVAGEFSGTGRLYAEQEIVYFLVQGYHTKHRDIPLSALARVNLTSTSRMSVQPVGGFSVVRVDTSQSATAEGRCCAPASTLGPYGPYEHVGHWSWGLTFGSDFAVRVSDRVSMVPQLRVHWIHRTLHDWHEIGLSSWVFRPGVSMRATF
jgi:hypothetical protein